MNEQEWLVQRFEQQRPQLRAVAYRMLGSLADADDAVQDAWERLSRADAEDIENLGAWLTTVVARVCLNVLRTRNTRRENLVGAVAVPDPIVSPEGQYLPEDEMLLADSVGLALQVVLDTLSPAERLAFVLHDMFDLPFDEIGPLMGRTAQATRQLASRARRRVRGAEPRPPERDVGRQRAVIDAFFAAGRAGDFQALVSLLHPDVVLRADFGPGQARRSTVLHGAEAVAQAATLGWRIDAEAHPALVNGTAGVVITREGRPFAVMAFTISNDKIVEIDGIGDPERVERLAAAVLSDSDTADSKE